MSEPSQIDKDQLDWLKNAWRTQSARVQAMSERWSDMRVKGHMAPKLTDKLVRLLDQISFSQKEEQSLVDEIEAMEKKHRMMREQNLLKQAEPANDSPFNPTHQQKPKPKNAFWEGVVYALLLKRLWAQDKPAPHDQ